MVRRNALPDEHRIKQQKTRRPQRGLRRHKKKCGECALWLGDDRRVRRLLVRIDARRPEDRREFATSHQFLSPASCQLRRCSTACLRRSYDISFRDNPLLYSIARDVTFNRKSAEKDMGWSCSREVHGLAATLGRYSDRESDTAPYYQANLVRAGLLCFGHDKRQLPAKTTYCAGMASRGR